MKNQISEKSDRPASQRQTANLEQGVGTRVQQETAHEKTNWLLYQTRMTASATQANLALEAGRPALVEKLTKSLAGILSAGASMLITLNAAAQARRLWLLPPRDFPQFLRVTLWITTAIHLDTLNKRFDPFSQTGNDKHTTVRRAGAKNEERVDEEVVSKGALIPDRVSPDPTKMINSCAIQGQTFQQWPTSWS